MRPLATSTISTGLHKLVSGWDLLRAVVVYYWTLADTFPRPLDGTVVERFSGHEQAWSRTSFPYLSRQNGRGWPR